MDVAFGRLFLLLGAVAARRQVSRRNSYSDRDMFEGGEDEEDVPMKVSGQQRGLARSWGQLFCARVAQKGSRGLQHNPDVFCALAVNFFWFGYSTTLVPPCPGDGG